MKSELKAVAPKVAEKEIERWLDFKKIKEGQREKYKDSIERLIEAVQEGTLEVDTDCNLTHNLNFAISEKVTKIAYKPRLMVGELDPYLKGIKAGDSDLRLRGYVCALTDQAIGIIKKLDTSDYAISQTVAIFFLD